MFQFSVRVFGRIYFALGVLLVIILVGSLGFMLIEDYTIGEAFYMTIITISTVGFGEVHPLGTEGRIFVSILILSSIGLFAYVISAITTYFVAGEYAKQTKQLRINQGLNKLNDHVVICGYGRVGRKASKDLLELGKEFVIIEKSDERYELLSDNPSIHVIKGDATHDEVLRKARLETAKALITTLPNDADNLYVVLTARDLQQNLTIISRASQPESVKKLRVAGADNVILPDIVGGAHMASLVIYPDVMEFLDYISVHGEGDINLEEIAFKDLPPDFQYNTLGEIEAKNRIGINIIGFKNSDGGYIINPDPETRIVPNSKLFVLGNKNQIKLLNRLFGITPPT